jgi:hypothetical protein
MQGDRRVQRSSIPIEADRKKVDYHPRTKPSSTETE